MLGHKETRRRIYTVLRILTLARPLLKNTIDSSFKCFKLIDSVLIVISNGVKLTLTPHC